MRNFCPSAWPWGGNSNSPMRATPSRTSGSKTFITPMNRATNSLALAARKLVWVAPFQAFQSKQVQQFGYSGFDIRSLPFLDLQAEGDVFEHGHVLEQGVVLEDEPDVALLHGQIINALAANEHVTGGRHFQTGDHTQHRRLAAAAGSEQGHQLALFY